MYAQLEGDFVNELNEQARKETTLTALLEKYGRPVFEQRLLNCGVPPALQRIFTNDLRQIELGSITASEGATNNVMR